MKRRGRRGGAGRSEARHAARARHRLDRPALRRAARGPGVARASTASACRPRKQTAAQARSLGIPLTDLDETPALDLTVDGADEIGPRPGADQGRRRRAAARKDRRRGVRADGRHRRRQQERRDARAAFRCRSRSTPSGLGATRRAVAAVMTRGRSRRRPASCGMTATAKPFVTDGGTSSSMLFLAAFPLQKRSRARCWTSRAWCSTGSFSASASGPMSPAADGDRGHRCLKRRTVLSG